MGATLQEAGDDLPRVERPSDIERDLDELAQVLVWLLRQHTAGKITARANALACRQGKEGVRLAALGVLLETLDDKAPGVVDRSEVVLRHRGRPVRVTEQHAGLPVFGGGDVPGDGRAIPVGKVGKGRPFNPLSGLELVDPHPLRRAAKTEGRNRAYRGLGLALRGPEGGEPFHG